MSNPDTPKAPVAPRQAMLHIGPLKLTGVSAQLVLLAILGGIVWLIVRAKPWVNPSPLWLSGVLWVVFQVYWSVAASSASMATRSESAKSRAVHQYLFLASIVLLFAHIPGLRWQFLPRSATSVLAGLAIQVLSLWFAIAARRALGRHWSGEITAKVDHELIRTGPYAFARHPIYTDIIGMFAGTAVVSGELHALAGAVLIIYAYLRKIRLEERELARTFGDTYEQYRRETRALIPWVL